MYVYLDNILIFSKSLAEHKIHVHGVLQRLLDNSLFVKAEKCEFHIPSVTFLGYIFQGGQVKIQAVAEWPNPMNLKQLQRFLGFCKFLSLFYPQLQFD